MRWKKCEAARFQQSVTGILSQRELTLGDEDSLVGIVEVRRDDMPGWKPYQEIHAASRFVGMNHHPFGPVWRALLVRPIGCIEIDDNRFRIRLAGCDRDESRDQDVP